MQINVLEYLEASKSLSNDAKIAVIDREGEYTFAELESKAKKLAGFLVNEADVTNVPIAVFLPKCFEAIVADLGILYAGNIYTNLDVKSPAERLRNILGNIGPRFVITSRELEKSVRELGVPPECIVLVEQALASGESVQNDALLARLARVIDTDPLCIINTSGSTGTPKGVVMNHRSVIDFMDWCFETFHFDGSERIGSLSPFFFDIYTLELYLCLAKRATLVIIPEQLSIFPVKLVEHIAEARVSFLFWVPTIMVNISNMDILSKVPLPTLRRVFFAGEVFPTKHFNYWRRNLPGSIFVNLYGPIEITVDCTYYVVDRDFDDTEPLPIGFPCRNTDILILNEDEKPAAPGEHGELCVRGSSLAMGYWNEPEKTRKAFVQNPLNTKYPETIYRTGDWVYTNTRGEIMFVGRRDFLIKHQGYRIDLTEIEHVVVGLSFVRNACALYNKEKKEITLFFEPQENFEVARLRQVLTEKFPKYMVPTAYHLLEAMPRNPNGKIDRQYLTRTYLGG